MEVILLEKIRNLGDIGARVSVKPGYAHNYLIPYGKAVTANEENIVKFAKMREELEKNAKEALGLACERKAKLENTIVTIPMKATEEGKLFGSVSVSNIVEALQKAGFEVKKSEISMPAGAIRKVGEYEIVLLLHSDVTVKIKINVVAVGD